MYDVVLCISRNQVVIIVVVFFSIIVFSSISIDQHVNTREYVCK